MRQQEPLSSLHSARVAWWKFLTILSGLKSTTMREPHFNPPWLRLFPERMFGLDFFFQSPYSPLSRNIFLKYAQTWFSKSCRSPHHPSWVVIVFTSSFPYFVGAVFSPTPVVKPLSYSSFPEATHFTVDTQGLTSSWPFKSVIPRSLIFVSLCRVCVCGMHLSLKDLCCFTKCFYNQYLRLHGWFPLPPLPSILLLKMIK